jgi:hypothetical protein
MFIYWYVVARAVKESPKLSGDSYNLLYPLKFNSMLAAFVNVNSRSITRWFGLL